MRRRQKCYNAAAINFIHEGGEPVNMKFLHLSDLHIGRRLGGISLMEDQLDALNQALEMASRL